MDISLNLRDYLKTLSEASLDDKKEERLIESDFRAYKLDTLTVQVCKKLRHGQTLSGCDAYWKANGTHWFIEFKNQNAKGVYDKRDDIWKKAYDSVCTVRMAIEQEITLDALCQNSVFLVVYQDEKQEPESLRRIREQSRVWGKVREFIRDGLRPLEGKLYREVHTIPATEFQATWIPRIWGK